MRAYIVPILITLAACSPATPERDWNGTFSPYGKWKSDLGFTIDIARDGKYQICDDKYCSSGTYNRNDAELILVNFQHLPASRRLVESADIVEPCDGGSKGAPNAQYDCHNDIYFYDNVANVDHRRQCGGDRECVILGNVETAEGMFYKIQGR